MTNPYLGSTMTIPFKQLADAVALIGIPMKLRGKVFGESREEIVICYRSMLAKVLNREGYSLDEIAECLGKSQWSVRCYIDRDYGDFEKFLERKRGIR